jgi:hypothetical protein
MEAPGEPFAEYTTGRFRIQRDMDGYATVMMPLAQFESLYHELARDTPPRSGSRCGSKPTGTNWRTTSTNSRNCSTTSSACGKNKEAMPNKPEESLLYESVRMIEAHLERIADALETLASASNQPRRPDAAEPTATVSPPSRGPLEIMAAYQKERNDHTNRRPPGPHWD